LNNNKLINEKLICAFRWSVLPSFMKMHGPKNKISHITECKIQKLQGEHKVCPWLQTFITRKLHGIQTYFFF